MSKKKETAAVATPKLVKYAGRNHRPNSRYYAALKLMEQHVDSDYNTCYAALLTLGLANSTARNWVKQTRAELGLEAAVRVKEETQA